MRRGLARHLLTTGLRRLVVLGAERIRVNWEAGNAASSALYPPVGLVATQRMHTYAPTRCLDLAWQAHRAGSLPIAAVVTDQEGRILARGRNRLAEHDERSPHLPGTLISPAARSPTPK